MNALGLNAVTPHNPVVAGNFLYVAWYQAGLQVFDLTNPRSRNASANTILTSRHLRRPPKKSGPRITAEPWDMVCGTDNLQNALPTTYDGNWAVYPHLGQNRILTGDLRYGLQMLDATQVTAPLKNTVSDFDGDGKTDISVYNQSTGDWLIEDELEQYFDARRLGHHRRSDGSRRL